MSEAPKVPHFPADYEVPKVWSAPVNPGGAFGSINKPTAGAQTDVALPRGEHPLQLHSLATPNGVKVTVLLEELGDKYGSENVEYDAYTINIGGGDQFGSGFVAANPNSKIPALLHYANGKDSEPVRVFESASIMVYLCEVYDKDRVFLPRDLELRTECMSWVFWLMGSAPYLGGGFGHFYNYAPLKVQYAIDRFSMEVKRQMDVLDRHLGNKDKTKFGGGPYMLGDQYSIADMCIWPWYGVICLGKLYPGSDTFLDAASYTHVAKWAKLIDERPAVVRGKRVNKVFGDAPHMKERHSRADFDVAA